MYRKRTDNVNVQKQNAQTMSMCRNKNAQTMSVRFLACRLQKYMIFLLLKTV